MTKTGEFLYRLENCSCIDSFYHYPLLTPGLDKLITEMLPKLFTTITLLSLKFSLYLVEVSTRKFLEII